jgi:2-(1,2-epoxy-1,2-dihydrophenyl)acetyl-CoA isomerase
MSETSDINFEIDDEGIATITLCRPLTLNALTSEMAIKRLPEVCAEASVNSRVKVVVITGKGRGFCSGADVRERIPDVVNAADTATLERPIGAFIRAIWEIPKPVIAAVNGIAAGGGMSIACAADFRFMAESASFVPSFVKRGLMPDSGLTYLLPKLINRSKAMRILMTAAVVSPHEALEMGLADLVTTDENLRDAVREFASNLAAGPAVALSFTKRAIQRSDDSTFDSQLEFESWGQSMCFKTRDFEEGIRSFREKRSPRFEGR